MLRYVTNFIDKVREHPTIQLLHCCLSARGSNLSKIIDHSVTSFLWAPSIFSSFLKTKLEVYLHLWQRYERRCMCRGVTH